MTHWHMSLHSAFEYSEFLFSLLSPSLSADTGLALAIPSLPALPSMASLPLPTSLPAWWSFGWVLVEWAIRLAMLVYVPQRRAPAAARTWLLLIFFLPWLGLLLYALFGRIYYPRSRRRKLARINHAIERLHDNLPHVAHAELPPGLCASSAQLVERLGSFSPVGGTAVTLLDHYDDTLKAMIADIDAARQHVHLLMYIYENDGSGRAMTDALLRAAGRGVPCRIVLDALGARAGLKAFAGTLREGGVDVVEALPMRSLSAVLKGKSARFDLRNHRKILVVDGCIGHIGSQNVIDAEAIPGVPNEELVARVTGPAVAQLQAVFLADRYLETNDDRLGADDFPPPEPTGDAIAQMLPSGPGYGTRNAEMALVSLIHNARTRVVITTPYFVPDEPFLQALHVACFRGVDVRLVLSARIDQRFTQAAQEAYFGALMDAGVRIHLYHPAFLHAKHVTIDDEVVMIGSSNMDIRSFALNAEAALMIYDREVVAKVAAIQQRYIDHSAVVDRAGWSRRPLLTRTWQNLCRLADSLL